MRDRKPQHGAGVAHEELDPEQVVREVCGRIREIRVERGLTQEAMAERLGMTPRAYQYVEEGQNLTLKSLVRIANVLGARPRDLFVPPAPHGSRRGRARKAPRLG